FFFSSRRRHTRFSRDWSSDVCSSDLAVQADVFAPAGALAAADVDAQLQAGQRSAFVVARGDLAADAPGVCAAAAPHIDVLQHARALRLRRRQFRGHLRGEYRGTVQRGVDAAGGEVAADLHALSGVVDHVAGDLHPLRVRVAGDVGAQGDRALRGPGVVARADLAGDLPRAFAALAPGLDLAADRPVVARVAGVGCAHQAGVGEVPGDVVEHARRGGEHLVDAPGADVADQPGDLRAVVQPLLHRRWPGARIEPRTVELL